MSRVSTDRGFRILCAYTLSDGITRIWIITEADLLVYRSTALENLGPI
jgi:hypothetical protein